MDYSPSSVLVVPVVVVVGAGYVFLKDVWSDLAQIWTKDITPKTRKNFIFHEFDPKVNGQKVKYFILQSILNGLSDFAKNYTI